MQYHCSGKEPPDGWPFEGKLRMRNMNLQYGNQSPTLKNIDLQIDPKEKVTRTFTLLLWKDGLAMFLAKIELTIFLTDWYSRTNWCRKEFIDYCPVQTKWADWAVGSGRSQHMRNRPSWAALKNINNTSRSFLVPSYSTTKLEHGEQILRWWVVGISKSCRTCRCR